MFASLPWYDLAEIRGATDALWAAIARGLRARGVSGVPDRLDRATHYETQWRSGRLLFGQACGYDLAIAHADALRLVAAPRYRVAGCEGASYRSFVVVRDDFDAGSLAELRGARAAINCENSHSGMNALRVAIAPLAAAGQFFGSVVVSGAHEASLAMVRGGAADVAAVDCVTWALIARHRPGATAGLRIVCRTDAAPAPPYVTARATPERVLASLRSALADALRDPANRAAVDTLELDGIEIVDDGAYALIADQERRIAAFGYDELAPAGRKRRAGVPEPAQ